MLACASIAPLSPKAVQLNRAGVEALQQGDLEMAEARFALALEFHPRFVDALVNLGILEMQRGSFEQARQRFKRAVSINRHVAQPHHALGLLCEREGERANASEYYRRALEVDPGFVPSRANLARLLFESGELDRAREQFLRLTQAAPDSQLGYVGLIETLLRLGRTQEADQLAEQAAASLPQAVELRIYLARRELRKNNVGRAVQLLTDVAAEPGVVRVAALGWLGLAYLVQGDSGRAEAVAQQALAMDRDNALASYVLAMALRTAGNDMARLWLERADHLAPGDSVIRSELMRANPISR